MKLATFRKARRTLDATTKKGKVAIEHVSDLQFEPHAKLVHVYDTSELMTIIIERHLPDGKKEFAWLWSHPCDSVSPTLADAERSIFEYFF